MDFFRQFYTFDGVLGRLEFIICLVAMWLFLSIINSLVIGFIEPNKPLTIVIIKVVSPVVSVIFYTPIFIKRLRDMGWPKKLIVLLYTAAIFNQNMLMLFGDISYFVLPGLMAAVPAFILFLFMLLKPGKVST